MANPTMSIRNFSSILGSLLVGIGGWMVGIELGMLALLVGGTQVATRISFWLLVEVNNWYYRKYYHRARQSLLNDISNPKLPQDSHDRAQESLKELESIHRKKMISKVKRLPFL
jgi:predicted lipid-binding transport protein (Tim44 family)